jgi:hypothetical protein
MKLAIVLGMVLIGLGILSLAYFASPVRYMLLQSVHPHRTNSVIPILGGIALVSGIALLVAVQPRKKKSEL